MNPDMQAHALDLADASQAGLYFITHEDLAVLEAPARHAGLALYTIDLTGCRDKPDLLSRMAAGLSIPDDFGRNWDALSDALRDLGWQPSAAGHALLFDHADALQDADVETFDTLLEILEEAIAFWRDQDTQPLWVFMALPEDAFPQPDEQS